MERPGYLSKYLIDWELFEVVVGLKSGIDSDSFLGSITSKNTAEKFLSDYGFEQDKPILQAELFGNYQEAIQFIKKYFLKEQNPEGLDLEIPLSLSTITDLSELFLMATGNTEKKLSMEEKIWAGIILKVLHTIVHIDRDLRHRYFPTIQQQICDKFYRYIFRDQNDNLYLGDEEEGIRIPLVDFHTKAKKSRDSIIIKLLHKAENVAEELFDRIGLRLVTENLMDVLRVVQFLQRKNVVIPHNIKTSRSMNTLIDLKKLKGMYGDLVKLSLRNNLPEERFGQAFKRAAHDCLLDELAIGEAKRKNPHSAKTYRAIQFTCRQLIKYTNPEVEKIYQIRKMAREIAEENPKDPLAREILGLNYSAFSRTIRFFYPFEVQVVDVENQEMNTDGDASHLEYKRSQLKTAQARLFRPLLKYLNISPN